MRVKNAAGKSISLELQITVPEIPFLVATAKILREEWSRLGVRVKVVQESQPDVEARIKNRDYEVLVYGNLLSASSDLYPFWHSSQRFYPGLNLALYNNKNADSLMESIREQMDPGKRTLQFQNLIKEIQRDSAAAFLYSPSYEYLLGRDLKGVSGGFISAPPERFASIANWYVTTKRVAKPH